MTDINEIIKGCELCSLRGTEYALSRIHRGEGKKVMFIGEAPGEEEGKQHLAFVGRSGKLLDKWIEYLGIDNYVITNIVRHRPPNNRIPSHEEIAQCISYLYKELENEEPYYVIALGRTSALVLGYMTNMESMMSAIERVRPYGSQSPRTFVFYHPSYILRTHKDMTPYLDDLKKRLK